ncbi:DALR anticodon-binding domain-containing protein 3 [Sabethes cyaneus]|uniref:DALR anticodon-binding domain-containing protein 3 n=1 Tax=Sabethes cyaneus TaxID=53552 RepID=UPI00237EA472|nr:DALR anticodon-binding domain-containing protein 3 [Sabethes cyaneus]
MDILNELAEKLQSYLRNHSKYQFSLKYQNKHLSKTGDIMLKPIDQEVNAEFSFEPNSLITEGRKWNITINECKINNGSVSLFLNRVPVYRNIIGQIIENKLAPAWKHEQICITCDVEESDHFSMTNFRMLSVYNIVRNIIKFNGYDITNNPNIDGIVEKIIVGKSSSLKAVGVTHITCAPVITNGISANDYIRKRANDMQLIAQHKYGIRVKDQQRFQVTVASLGRSAAIVDMLESKANSQIDLKKEKNKSSKGAAFILYNYARLSVLFKTFDQKQHTNYYPPLPAVVDIDFSLLTEEDEWQLFWVYVAGFPAMMQHASGNGQLVKIAPHIVLSFASGLVISLSKYYRRIRILTENRNHLLPVMFARIYLLKSVYIVLSTLMALLDLEPIAEM